MKRARRVVRNPLLAEAYAAEPSPCAIVKAGVLAEDDRAGVHFTDDWGVAAVYAAFKAEASRSIPIVLTYDLHMHKLVPDFDAQVERQYADFYDIGYYVEEFDILEDPDDPDYERLADIIEGDVEVEVYDEDRGGPPYFVSEELKTIGRGSQSILAVLVDKLREGGDDAELALKAIVENASETLPLEWYAEAIKQWRTFQDVEDDLLVRVTAIQPYHNEINLDDEEWDLDACPRVFGLDDLGGDIEAMVEEGSVTLWETREPRMYLRMYHGTDLTRAQAIFADNPEVRDALRNPWAPCVMPEE